MAAAIGEGNFSDILRTDFLVLPEPLVGVGVEEASRIFHKTLLGRQLQLSGMAKRERCETTMQIFVLTFAPTNYLLEFAVHRIESI